MSLRFAGRLVVDLMFPPRCALCRSEGAFICDRCTATLPRADGDRCDRCWLPLRYGRCFACEGYEPAFEALRSCFSYGGGVHDLVHALKFKRQSALAEPLGRFLAETIEEHALEADAVVPVPLHTMRRRDRGFDQALLLAREAVKNTKLPVIEALERRTNTPAQARSMDAKARRLNVRDAFSLRPGRDIDGRTLLLVDDVATTGATLDACARVLLAGGAASVLAVTVARDD